MCLEYILRKHFFRVHIFSKLLSKVICLAALGVGLTIQFVSVFNEGHQYVALESILAYSIQDYHVWSIVWAASRLWIYKCDQFLLSGAVFGSINI